MKPDFDIVQNFGLCSGDIADIHVGKMLGVPVAVKKARTDADRDLLDNEAIVLQDLMEKLLAEPKAKDWSYAIPQIIGTFKTPRANVLELFSGFISVEDIRKVCTGVDGRTLVWQWKRLLGILSWVHHFGYTHGAVLPPHVLYFPDGSIKDERIHSVRLIDWCYAIDKKESKLKAWVPDYEDFYPPEVKAKKNVGPWTDLYMAGKTMIYLAGGNVKDNKFPSRIPGQLANQIRKCLEPKIKLRAQSVSDVFESFVATAGDVYGKRKFHEFKVAI